MIVVAVVVVIYIYVLYTGEIDSHIVVNECSMYMNIIYFCVYSMWWCLSVCFVWCGVVVCTSSCVCLYYPSCTPLCLLFHTQDDYTGLIYASKKGHLAIVKYLVEKGADVNHKSNVKHAIVLLIVVDYC